MDRVREVCSAALVLREDQRPARPPARCRRLTVAGHDVAPACGRSPTWSRDEVNVKEVVLDDDPSRWRPSS